MEETFALNETETTKIEIVTLQKFIVLSIVSYGLYDIWWMYKTWKFFKEKDNLDIMPVPRAIFALFFMIGPFDRIQDFSQSKGYTKTFSSLGCFLGVICFNLLGRLPEPYFIISFVSFLFFIPALEAFNHAIRNSANLEVTETERFNTRQLVLLICGGVFWLMVLMGFAVD
ncbi:hypothetical protein O4H26_10120 [Aequorivita viscosa]|nr:hypothetical protein [Aequorivita viscosa]